MMNHTHQHDTRDTSKPNKFWFVVLVFSGLVLVNTGIAVFLYRFCILPCISPDWCLSDLVPVDTYKWAADLEASSRNSCFRAPPDTPIKFPSFSQQALFDRLHAECGTFLPTVDIIFRWFPPGAQIDGGKPSLGYVNTLGDQYFGIVANQKPDGYGILVSADSVQLRRVENGKHVEILTRPYVTYPGHEDTITEVVEYGGRSWSFRVTIFSSKEVKIELDDVVAYLTYGLPAHILLPSGFDFYLHQFGIYSQQILQDDKRYSFLTDSITDRMSVYSSTMIEKIQMDKNRTWLIIADFASHRIEIWILDFGFVKLKYDHLVSSFESILEFSLPIGYSPILGDHEADKPLLIGDMKIRLEHCLRGEY